jgi:hypothetical protein
MALWVTKCTASHTHTNLYGNDNSHCHPSNKQAVLSTVTHGARSLCDEDSLQAELVFLRDVFKQNAYNEQQLHRALNGPSAFRSTGRTQISRLPALVGTIFNRNRRVLARRNIKSVGFLHIKLSSLLRPVKERLRLRTPSVYRSPCACGRVYLGQTGRSVDIRLKEHHRHILLKHPEKSAAAEHNIEQGHRIQFHSASILATKTIYGPHCQGGHWDWTPLLQYQEKWLLLSQ